MKSQSSQQQDSNLGPPDPQKLQDMWRMVVGALASWVIENENGNGTGKSSKS